MSQGPSLYYRCTLMFITGRRCIGENWVDFQYEPYRMRRRRAHLALAAWHTMILSQYFLLFISVCFINQCHYNVITPFHYLCKQGYSAPFWWNCTNVQMEPAYMQSARCQVKIIDTNPAPSKHWHPPPSVGCVALTVDGSFSAANPVTKYQQLILAIFQGVLFSERSTNLFFFICTQCHNFDTKVQSYFRVIGVVLGD